MTPARHTRAPAAGAAKQLVAFVHAAGRKAPEPAWLEALAALGLRVFSHGDLPGCERTQAAWPRLGALCAEIAAAAPDCGLLVLRAPLQLDAGRLQGIRDLLDSSAGPTACAPLSNGERALNPFAGLDGPTGPVETARFGELVALLGQRVLHELPHWPAHCVALNARAVILLADPELSVAGAPERLRAHGAQLQLPEWLYLHDPSAPAFAALVLEPHEAPRPVPWGGLAERLDEWLKAGPDDWPVAGSAGSPVTLHISHSWGGGVARWIRSFIEAEPQARHLQLLAEGPQSHQGAGQRLSLYAGDALGCAVQRWWLQPPVEAVDIANPQYREVLQAVCERFGVGRIIVSSLVGHSLDALRTGLPTVQVLHDHFPAWPLLSVHPERFDGDLAAALGNPATRREFPGVSLAYWQRVREAYRDTLQETGVRLVAPSRSAADIHARLHPDWAGMPIEVIPHGVPPLPAAAPVEPRPCQDGRLRLLVPGRMQAGKGLALLQAALPLLTPHARVYLLGTGKEGEAFFGQPGVHVVLEYRREELPELVAGIGPHLAALLSVVPETFSYTLSEMAMLGVPVMATRSGSFTERIEDGRTGWLVEPEPEALAERLAELAADPGLLEPVRHELAQQTQRAPAQMAADYARLCPAELREPAPPQASGLTLQQAQTASLHDLARRRASALERAGRERAGLQREVEERTRWALDTERDLAGEIERRKAWVESLNRELDESRAEHARTVGLLDAANESLDRTRQQLDRSRQELESLERGFEDLKGIHEQVLSSSSWRITRPLRVARRLGHNFLRARAWNPLRWPLLFSQLVRNLATVGLRGALLRMQQNAHAATAEAPPREAVATPVDTTLPEAVPCAETPRVSIVVPVYNQLAYTAACLRSIVRADDAVTMEVLVVDDASGDATPGRLPGVGGLRYLRNEENLGFIGSCNRGAAAARGEFLVFLNNDTEVEEGWLERLLETFDARPDAGLVGARLLYPDGRLQECGGLVFSDGSGWNYGRGDDPARPEYQVLRETDYCSGACLMLRRELFESLGGFDPRYAPAYYEDTDLAFRVREQGLKVYVQPAATVVHHEGATSGTDTDTGAKRFQMVNQGKFRERWATLLDHQPDRLEDPGDAPALRAARDHRLRGRVLLIDAYTPEPDQDSGSMRLTQLMGCLQELGYGVDFLPDNRAYAGRYTRALQAAGVQAWYPPWVHSLHQFFREHGPDYAAVLISRHYVAVNYVSLLRKYCPKARFVFDTVDLHYLREQRLADLEHSLPLERVARQTRRSELGVIADADATLVVSPVEQTVLGEDAPEARVHVVSNIHEAPGRRAGFAERSDLFFVGGYQHPPNVDAATWFVNDILPLVHARLPGVRFHLVGSKAPDSVRNLAGEGVVFHGFVESLDPFLDRCRLAVAPLRYGAGVKGKVNHSMAHGQPVVATPAAVEGLHAEHGCDILVAESAEAFADEVVRLYGDEDLWTRLSDQAIGNVQRHFSRDAAKTALAGLLEDLGL